MPLERTHLKSAKLQYVSDANPGLHRHRNGQGFRYVDSRGRPVRSAAVLRRIRTLAIPPAWQGVWICPQVNGHIQAVGRDQRGRKQYRYHPRWEEARDEVKFDHLIAFGKALPLIRRAVNRHLNVAGLPRQKVLAAVVKLLESSNIRIGNDEYVKQNNSFGLSTLHGRHAKVRGSTIQFSFRGKGGKWHRIDVTDRRLARIVRRCQDLPGQRLFEYLDDDGQVCAITSNDVNDYLREVTGDEFTAKDFRTWTGTLQAAIALRECGVCDSQARAKKQISTAVASVAQQLGNTPAICRKCYIHPAVITAFLKGNTIHNRSVRKKGGLSGDERAVLSLLGHSK